MNYFLQNGHLAAVSAMVFLVVNQLIFKWFFGEHDLNVWMFVSIQYFFGGLGLLSITGFQLTSKDTFKNPLTWSIGFFRLIDSIMFGSALIYISATEASILMSFGKIFIFIAARLAFGRLIGLWRLPGLLILFLPPALVTLSLENGFLNLGVIFILLTCLAMVIEMILVEKHPTLQRFTLADRYQSTGVNMVVIGLFFMVLLLSISFAKTLLEASGNDFIGFLYRNIPNPDHLFSAEMWIWGALTGLLVRAMYFFFRYFAIVKIQSANYTLIVTSQTLILYIFEHLLIKLGVFKEVTLSDNLFIYGIVLIFGALLCVGKSYQESIPYKISRTGYRQLRKWKSCISKHAKKINHFLNSHCL